MTNIVLKPAIVTLEEQSDTVELGQWYWVKDGSEEEELACVLEVGSNYIEVKFVAGSTTRVHLDEMSGRCRFEPNATAVIERNVLAQKDEVRRLLSEVESLTARLGVGHTARLGSGTGAALAKLDPNQDVDRYKTALVKAKQEDLPELLKKIEQANDALATWLKAETLPMKAQLSRLGDLTKRIDDKIFTIELYAGLAETVELIKDGEPATLTEKVRLMQRRCYMDEECLAQYEVGGMDFEDLPAFDHWLVRPENLTRLLPFPRCIVSFQIRRKDKKRPVPTSFISFFRQMDEMKLDKLTFLYIRNGERVYRMGTALEFGPQLFPDIDHQHLVTGTKLWGKVFAGRVGELITDNQFQGLVGDFERAKAEHDVKRSEHAKKLLKWRSDKKAAEAKGEEFDERQPHLWPFWEEDPRTVYQPYEPDNIYYDDMTETIEAEIQQSNRIAVIIQGLLDRSMVLHPHPPWKIWSPDSAEQALEFIYDSSRALVGGERPDFEAYRQKCNASLKVGSVTIGQEAVWREKYAERKEEYGRRRYYDPGPDTLARVTEYQKKGGRCTYAWLRDGSGDNYGKQFRSKLTCDVDRVFNVDAYKPGDFRQFFADPRTRADYLEWAPFLLEAEEYHAGNRKVEDPPPPEKKKSSHSGRLAYAKRKRREYLKGRVVRSARDISTTGGNFYEAGTIWKVTGSGPTGMTVQECTIDGKLTKGGGYVTGVDPYHLTPVDG